jgi:integrase
MVARTRRRLKLPSVLSAEKITRILDHTTNLKHWTIIATFYATGLRCNELRNLKVKDINSQRLVIHVREGKGGFRVISYTARYLRVSTTRMRATPSPFHALSLRPLDRSRNDSRTR